MSPDRSLLDVPPGIPAELDPGFRPAILAVRNYRKAVREAGPKGTEQVLIGLERQGGLVARRDLDILAFGSNHDADTYRYVERMVKSLLWLVGGWRLHMAGPKRLIDRLRADYSATGARAFDADLIAGKVYGRELEVAACEPADMPPERGSSSRLGGHLDGCRIGFDLGASDYKLAAVKDGEAVFSTEIPWQPTTQSDIDYHYSRITEGFRLAASHLPRVDAIGGSSAGIYIDSQVMVASLFRGLSAADFESQAKPMFLRMREEWGVPLEVANDGDVTALAGAMSLGVKGVLGIAMGSSEAAGYLDAEGALTGWLSELAFAPADFNPTSEADEWSRDHGVGAMSFSQQAVNKLAPAAGFSFPDDMLLPERLVAVQEQADAGDAKALSIFSTIGVYLGYAIPWYADFYDLSHLLILGRVTSGTGGERIIERAKHLLESEFPETAERVELHVPDEKSRRVGQAVAAASLPELPQS